MIEGQQNRNMSRTLLSVLGMVEDFVDGSLIHKLLLNCPIGFCAAFYRQFAPVVTTFLCFKWISPVIFNLPTTGMCGLAFRGVLLPFLFLEYVVFQIINSQITSDPSVIVDYFLLCRVLSSFGSSGASSLLLLPSS